MFRCSKCFKSCPTPSSYKAHMYNYCENQFKCEQCSKTFPFLSGIANHKRAHLKQKLFKCFAGSCHCAIKHLQDLHWHIGRHFNTHFTCNECGHWTFQKCKLTMWMSTNITATIAPLRPNINGQLTIMKKYVIDETITRSRKERYTSH